MHSGERLLSRVEVLPVARGHLYALAVGYDVLSDPESGVFALASCRGELLLGVLRAERGGPFGDPVSGWVAQFLRVVSFVRPSAE